MNYYCKILTNLGFIYLMKSPLISIITPAYKAQKTIRRTVKSLIGQDFLDWEMIIISDDQQNYEEILLAQDVIDKRLQFISTDGYGLGAAHARNRGLQKAKGQYIASLDADDVFKPDKLSKMIPLVENYGAAVSDIEIRDNNSNLLLEKLNLTSDQVSLGPKEILWVCLHSCSVYLYDRNVIKDLFYDEHLSVLEDNVFLMSFFNHLEKIGYTKEPHQVYYKRNDSLCNSSNTHIVFHNAKMEILEKLDSNQISIKNKLAKVELKRYIEFGLEIDKIYDEKILNNQSVEWLEIFKNKLQELKL